MTSHQPMTILLVEDDPGHAVLIEKNLRRAGISHDIVTVNDGQSAVDVLLKETVPRATRMRTHCSFCST